MGWSQNAKLCQLIWDGHMHLSAIVCHRMWTFLFWSDPCAVRLLAFVVCITCVTCLDVCKMSGENRNQLFIWKHFQCLFTPFFKLKPFKTMKSCFSGNKSCTILTWISRMICFRNLKLWLCRLPLLCVCFFLIYWNFLRLTAPEDWNTIYQRWAHTHCQ